MAKCHICGQSTDSGSVCRHCRAALNRLRERTAPPGDAHPGLAFAGAGVAGGSAAPAPTPATTGFLRRRKDAGTPASPAPAIANASTPGPEASASRSVPWLPIFGLALLVSVGGVAIYQLVDAGSPPPAAKGAPLLAEPSPPAVRVLETPAPAPILPPVLELPHPASASSPVGAAELRRTPEKHAGADATRAPEAARQARPATSIGAPAGTDAAAASSAPMGAPTTLPATAPAVPAAKARWARMDAALEECAQREFLNRLICREKVRMEYCEGQWGKTDRCPGTPATEHAS